MPRILTDGNLSIGAYKFSDRKRPALCVAEGNTIVVYGYFQSEKGADEFMDKLGRMVGARMDGE